MILSRVTEEDIFIDFGKGGFAPDDFDPRKRIRNPLREDNTGGCWFFQGTNGRWHFHDPSNPEYQGDCFNFVARANNLDPDRDFKEVLRLIDESFDLGLSPKNFKVIKGGQSKQIANLARAERVPMIDTRTEFDLEYYAQWAQAHMDYWGQYYISKRTLNFFDVRPVRLAWIGTNTIWKSKKSDLVYRYPINSTMGQHQLYRPDAPRKGDRFRTNAKGKPLMGLNKLPERHDFLIITSSYKDVMQWFEIGVPAICPIGEGTTIAPVLLTSLMPRFGNIFVNFDNDDAGMRCTDRLLDSCPLMYRTRMLDMYAPDPYKDVSDFVKHVGLKNAKEEFARYIKPYAPF